MAMKVKPDTSSVINSTVIRTPIGLAVFDNVEDINLISGAVSNVIHSKASITSNSKYKPRSKKAVKKEKAKKVKQTKVLCPPKPKAKPMLKNSWANSDDMRYAMWWAFHTDPTKGEYPNYRGIKVHSIDISSKEKERIIRQSKHSEYLKKQSAYLEKLGVKPRGKQKHPLLGSAPHPSDKEAFEFGVSGNQHYQKELIRRYAEGMSICKHLRNLGVEQVPFVDHLDITRTVDNTSVQQDLNVSDMISKLEVVVAKDQLKTTADIERENQLARATAEVFDEDYPSSKPSDTVASDTSAPWDEDQSLDKRTALEHLHSVGKEPWGNYPDTHRDECLSLYRKTKTNRSGRKTSWLTTPSGQRHEGARYTRWLFKHNNFAQRDSVEYARSQVLPGYSANLGTDVHPMYHLGVQFFENMIKHYNFKRIALYDYGIINNDSFGNFIKRAENMAGISGEYRSLDIAEAVSTMIDEQDNKECAELIVDKALADRKAQDLSSLDGMEAANDSTEKEITAEVDSVSPTPDDKGAEIISLDTVRNKRSVDTHDLMSKIRGKLEDLTAEEYAGAVKFMKAFSDSL